MTARNWIIALAGVIAIQALPSSDMGMSMDMSVPSITTGAATPASETSYLTTKMGDSSSTEPTASPSMEANSMNSSAMEDKTMSETATQTPGYPMDMGMGGMPMGTGGVTNTTGTPKASVSAADQMRELSVSSAT
jgi:hypothetical protein